MIVMRMTEDTARVVTNALEVMYTAFPQTRDGLIAHQTEVAIKHAFMPEYTPKPTRWADEPMPVVEVTI